jgi:uncharacterized protein with FMN-binding domain
LESSNLYTFQKSTEKRRGFLGSTAVIVVASVLGGFGITSWLNPAETEALLANKPKIGDKPASAVGDEIDSNFGMVQVKVSTESGKIKAIELMKAESSGKRDAAFPILIEAALAANSSEVENVSNATYSSEAFKKSLQSALDKIR